MTLWGPPSEPPEFLKFSGAPYAPFSKGDKLGKVADWAADPSKDGKDQKRSQGGRGGLRDPYHAYGAQGNNAFFSGVDGEQDSSWSFSIVDSSAKPSSSGLPGGNAVLKARGRAQQSTGRPSSIAGRTAGQGGAPQQRQPSTRPPGPRTTTIGSAAQLNRGRPGGSGPGGAGRWGQHDRNKNREPSVTIMADWKLVQSNNLSELIKLSYDVDIANARELGRYGYVPLFNRSMDKLLTPKRLRPVDRTVYNVTTSEDPVIQKLAEETPKGVFTTDTILALLMCATKTNNPWDVVVRKRGDQIFLDKRDGSAIDFLTVDENAYVPPADVSENKMDTTQALSIEATYINQNFAANVVEADSRFDLDSEHPNPFSDGSEPESEPLLPRGYIYKSFNLESDPEAADVPLVVRLEVDAAASKDGDLLSVKALNEYGGGTKPLEWKQRFQTHRGAIVAAEMKNNLAKMSQWTTQALLANVKSLKIGFVSRANAKNKAQHEIVGVITADPRQFATQLNLKLTNGWGIVKSLYNIFSSLEDGTYIVLRDPNVQALRIYSVPNDSSLEDASA